MSAAYYRKSYYSKLEEFPTSLMINSRIHSENSSNTPLIMPEFKEFTLFIANKEEAKAAEKDSLIRKPLPIHNPSPEITYAKELENIPRVNEFVYRGMKRSPELIKEAGGIWSRLTDPHFPDKKKKYGVSFQDLERHVEDSDGAFISTTRSIAIAKHFAMKEAKKTDQAYGYVYCLRANAAIDTSKIVLSRYEDEQEISIPGGVDYENIIAYRKVDSKTGLFIGNIYFSNAALQKGLIDKFTIQQVFNDLKGKPQPIDEYLTEKRQQYIF